LPAGISQILSTDVRHVPVLAYVNVQSPAGQYSTTPADFQAQMDWLEAQGYVPQKLSDYIRWMRGEMELPRNACVLTFWDAQRSVIDNAFPILQAKNFKFTVFVPGAVVANEAALTSGLFLQIADLQILAASGLCELHAEGYHSLWSYKGIAVNVQQIYKSAQVNLKWGGIGEQVEDVYSFAPLIGTNNSLQPVTSTYAFTLLPRSYRGSYLWPEAPAGLSPLTPTQIVARCLFIDQLRVVGTVPTPLPLVKVYAKKSSDSAWTTIKTGWQPDWSAIYEVVTLDTPFTFRTGVRYDLKFETQSAPAEAGGELVTIGNRTAVGLGGEATLVSSNSSAPPGFSSLQEGGDIYLMESLAAEAQSETAARATADAQKGLDFLAPYQPQEQVETAHAHAYSAYTFGTFSLPSSLRKIFPLQLWRQNLINDRWSSLNISHPQYTSNVPTGWPNRQLLAAFPVDGQRSNSQIQSTIDALSGLAWDDAADWDVWSVRLGYSHPYTPNFYTELPKYARAFTHITTRGLRWNSDATFAAGTQDNSQATLDNLADFMKLKPVREHPRVLAYLHHFNAATQTWDPDLSRGVFQNKTAAVDSIVNLLLNVHPTLAGVVLDFEGCYKEDRSIASSFIQELWSRMQTEAPGRILISFLPYKTADDPNDPWSGWCDYDVWPQNSTYANLGTYDETFDTPGPIASISWMTAGLNFLATKIPKAQILIGMQFYGHWGYSAIGAPPWAMLSGNYYDAIKAADDNDGTWSWDATAQENLWQNGAGTWKGYSATPRGFKAKLDNFVADGYGGFSIWAIGHGDAVFYKNAEEITAVAPLVKLPSGVGQRVNDREGSGSVGQFDVEVLERAEDIELSAPAYAWQYFADLARVMQQQQLHGKKVRLRMGYTGINPPQFPVFDTLEVDRVEVNDQQTGWRLYLVDPKRSLKSRIFTAATKETPLILSGNPMDLLLVVYQNHLGVGQNPNLSSDAWLQYDPATGSNLINPNRYLDVDSILAYRSGFFRNYYLGFSIAEPQEGKAWLEREIYKALGGYPVVDSAGRISPRFWIAPPLAGTAPVFSFTDQNLLEMPAAERAPIVNQATVRMDYDGSKFQTILSYVSGTSFSTFGLQGGQVIESRGLRAARQGISHAALLATKLFRRYGSVVPVWRAVAFHVALPVEVGDLVELTHSKVLDPMTGQRGVTNILCEVLEKQPDYGRARVSFRLLDVRYLAGKTPFDIAGTGVPDWPSATQQQKDTYVFIASDSSGLMSDGVAGNSIYG